MNVSGACDDTRCTLTLRTQMLNERARVTLYNILQSAAIPVGVGGDMRLLRSNENWCFRRLRLIRPSSSLEDGNRLTRSHSRPSRGEFRIIGLAIIAMRLRKYLEPLNTDAVLSVDFSDNYSSILGCRKVHYSDEMNSLENNNNFIFNVRKYTYIYYFLFYILQHLCHF